MKPKWERGELNIDVYLMCSWKEKVKWDSKPDRKFCKGSEENSKCTEGSQEQTPKNLHRSHHVFTGPAEIYSQKNVFCHFK